MGARSGNQTEDSGAPSTDGELISVSFAGELDLSTAGDMRARLAQSQVLDAQGVQIDLTQVTFLDSSSIGVLIAACKRVRSGGGAFSVICEDGSVRRTLEVAGLLDFLDVRGAA
jgi:anti-sigma B factor antagonist